MDRAGVSALRLFGLLVCLGLGACGAERVPRRIVLITVDTLRLDAFAGTAERPSAMPLTRRWAEQGLVFERAHAATSSTQPTHASLFTGLHPWEHGVSRNGVRLHADFETVAERLAAAGYRTGAAVASFPLHHRFGLDQGFDLYSDTFDAAPTESWLGIEVEAGRFHSLADDLNRRALGVLEALGKGDQFLWLHYFDPHAPYGDAAEDGSDPADAPSRPESLAELIHDLRKLYDADVRALDAALQTIRQRLEADSLRFETHVVFTADHGESFGERGVTGHGDHIPDEQIRVPLFIVSPGVRPGSRRDVVGSVDVAATLLDVAGLGTELGHGRSVLDEEGDAPRIVLGMRSTIDEGAVEVLEDGTRRVLPRHRFYQVHADGAKRGNGKALDPDVERSLPGPVAEELRSRFAAFERELERRAPPADLDFETRRGLEALGYLEGN